MHKLAIAFEGVGIDTAEVFEAAGRVGYHCFIGCQVARFDAGILAAAGLRSGAFELKDGSTASRKCECL